MATKKDNKAPAPTYQELVDDFVAKYLAWIETDRECQEAYGDLLDAFHKHAGGLKMLKEVLQTRRDNEYNSWCRFDKAYQVLPDDLLSSGEKRVQLAMRLSGGKKLIHVYLPSDPRID